MRITRPSSERIAERFAKLRDERCKARLGDMNAGPERGVQLLVWYGVRLVPDEDQQQVERFRREMDVDPLPSHQARADVDDNRDSRSAMPRRIIREGLLERSPLAMHDLRTTRIRPIRCTVLPAGATFRNRAATARHAAPALTRRKRRR